MPHVPGCAAPQRPQPASAASLLLEDPATAKTESCFSTFRLLQWAQSVLESYRGTIFSKPRPQSLQMYSKIGIKPSVRRPFVHPFGDEYISFAFCLRIPIGSPDEVFPVIGKHREPVETFIEGDLLES